MSKKHAMLSASGASRWLTCTPSARLEATVEEVESPYADEGTLAHELADLVIKQFAFGVDMSKKIEKLIETEEGKLYYNEEMQDYINEYAEFVVNRVREAPPGAILIQEERLELSEFIPEGFGTLDNGIAADEVLEIIDLKYGKGVPVDAYENSQLKVYALGALRRYDLIFNIHTVRMTIYQPRISNISTYEMSVDDLLKWGRETLRRGALMAFEGVGEFVPGDHCRFCRVRATCKANAELNLRLAAREFDVATLKDEQVVKILNAADRMKKWITSVEEYALRTALAGKKWPGLKVVRGRSNRKYIDEKKIMQGLVDAGYDGEQLVNKKMLGITELSKKVTKLHFKDYVEPYLMKPPGSPTLVPDTDGRPELDATQSAQDDFEDVT